MSLTDELRKLQELHQSGALTDEEFAKAKEALLNAPAPPPGPPPTYISVRGQDSLGDAAKAWVSFQIVMGIIGLIIVAIFFFGFFLPHWNRFPGG
jgi:hypothetical protein